MESFLSFFEQMPTWHRLVWVGVCLSAGWLAEINRPLFRFDGPRAAHARANLTLLITLAAFGAVIGTATVALFHWVERHEIGLLYLVDWPLWVELLVALLLLDLVAQYLAHFLLHKTGWLWRFHVIHHNDRMVDATTGTRLHPGDYLVREVFALSTVMIVGVPLAFYMFYRFLTVFFTYATHANIDMPRSLDRTLAFVFVTPNMHKFHHHFELPWTDSNYGNIFSVWDRAFGTLVYDDVERIRYGLNALDEGREDDALHQLRLPFRRRVESKTTL